MSDYQEKTPDMVETTDALEAVAVFRSWKNLCFIILILCLILIQTVFWLIDADVFSQTTNEPDLSRIVVPAAEPNISAVAEALTADANQAAPSDVHSETISRLPGISETQLGPILSITTSVAILAGILYCTLLFFSITLTVVGRLGGIRHICRAFFLSLILLILLIPWQTLFDAMTVGVLFSVQDIIDGQHTKAEGLYPTILYYLRFCGYWLVALVLLIMSQVRCARWSKSMLRRMQLI